MKKLYSPLVSIIMPTYNSARTVGETIASVQQQTYNNWELIITDDGSSDATVDLIKKFSSNDSRIILLQNKINSGAAISRNNSIRAAKGDFIAFLDSDDLWENDKLELQLNWMLLNDKVDFSFTAYQLIDENGKLLSKVIDLQGDNLSFSYKDMLLKKATLGCSTVILKRSAFKLIEMPNIRTGQDYALWLNLLKDGKRAYLFNKVLMLYRVMPNSISRNKIKKAKRQWQIYREIEKLPLWFSLICFVSYSWRALNRR